MSMFCYVSTQGSSSQNDAWDTIKAVALRIFAGMERIGEGVASILGRFHQYEVRSAIYNTLMLRQR